MPKIYGATLLNDIDHPGFSKITGSGVWWGTIANCLSNYNTLNDRLQIAGYTYLNSQARKSFDSVAGFWEMNKDDIPLVNGKGVSLASFVTRSEIIGMNNNYPSVKVGWVNENNIDRKLPVRWNEAGMKKLGSLGGHEGSANDINDVGQIVGYTLDINGNKRAFLWTEGAGQLIGQSQFVDLGTLGGRNSEAIAVNNTGQVVGWAEDETGQRRPFLWPASGMGGILSNLRMKDLLIDPFKSGIALDINEGGHVIGSVGEFGEPSIEGFFWSPETGTQLLPGTGGPTTVAQAINNNDEIVGYSFDAAKRMNPVIWENFQLFNLNDFVVNNYTWLKLYNAIDINADGNIVCSGQAGDKNGIAVSVLLSELYVHHLFPPQFYRRNFEFMGGMQDAFRGPVTTPDGQIVHIKPPGSLYKKRDDANLLMMMAKSALSLNDRELRKKAFSWLMKSGTKKAKKARKEIENRVKKNN